MNKPTMSFTGLNEPGDLRQRIGKALFVVLSTISLVTLGLMWYQLNKIAEQMVSY